LPFTLPLRLMSLAVLAAVAFSAPAAARRSARPRETASAASLRGLADHYRTLTWTWERVAHNQTTPTTLSYRRSSNPRYLRWTVDLWTRRAYRARARAVVRIRRRLKIELPSSPPLRARLWLRIDYDRRLALRLRRIYPGRVSHRFATVRASDPHALLRAWQHRGAVAALAVARHTAAGLTVPGALLQAFQCIHSYEGAWDANSGNGYYGGLQMDLAFQRRYGPDFVRRYGKADNWPVWAQVLTAVRAYRSGRGFWPWPRSARSCGLL
jgi:hypothetical protein